MGNENEIVLPVSQEDYDKVGGGRPSVGLHLAEISEIPSWKTENKSIKFPFVITEKTEHEGYVDELSAGIEPENKATGKKGSIWKYKQTMRALGVAETPTKGADGVVRPKYDQLAALGKKFYAEYTWDTDTRKPEEGGTGAKYPKCTSFKSLASGKQLLGLTETGDDESKIEDSE